MSVSNFFKVISVPIIVTAVIFINSCGPKKTAEDVDFNDSTKRANSAHVNSVLVHAIVKTMPPPVELTSFIKECGAAFDKSILNPIESRNKYSSITERSLALGVYGADLGYLNFFEKTYDAIEYLDVVRDLADQLSIGQFFDFSTLKRLATNKSSIDSIIYITTNSFERMNLYLAKQDRGNVSALMLIGGWIESMHLVCQAGKNHQSQSLIKQVGEQKIALDELIILIGLFKENRDFDRLAVYFNELKPLFEQVTINFEYREPITKEINGTLVVEDNSKKEVIISTKTFDAITQKIEEIRSYIVK